MTDNVNNGGVWRQDEYMRLHPEIFDTVDNPKHYTSGEIECIDAIRAELTPEEFRGYLKGNITKYIWRERLKGGAEDIEKAAWYIEELKKVDNGR